MEGPGISKSARDAQEAARTGYTYHCGVGDIEARPLKPCGKGERLLSDLGLRLVGLEWTFCNLLVGLTCGSTAAPPEGNIRIFGSGGFRAHQLPHRRLGDPQKKERCDPERYEPVNDLREDSRDERTTYRTAALVVSSRT
jgi:hypothetical protein